MVMDKRVKITKATDPSTSNRPTPPHSSIFSVDFPDGSTFRLPHLWEDVFVSYFGEDKTSYDHLAKRLQFLSTCYVKNQAWPRRLDGLGSDLSGDEKFDDPDFYWEHWDQWDKTGRPWMDRVIQTAAEADLAEAILVQAMWSDIRRKLSKEMIETVYSPLRRTPIQFLDELRSAETRSTVLHREP
jgi:hypothetical protein